MDVHIPTRESIIRSVTLNLQDVKKIFSRLEKLVHEEGDREIAKLLKSPEQSDEQWEARKIEIKEGAFRVTATLEGKSGDRLHGDNEALFASPNMPAEISGVYMTNSTAFRWWTKQNPLRSFELQFDFSKPKLLDSENFVSGPTPNASRLKIEADNESWIAAISEAVFGILSTKSNKHGFLHRAFVYDAGLLLFGLPFGLYLAGKASSTIQKAFGATNALIVSGAYIYVMLVAIWAYRVLFGYSKWAFPTVELKESSNSANLHRKFWYVIMTGLIVNIAWDFLSHR
jgi:hypothetical protein